MNIIITSEHRVGSRWLHYLLADILDMSTSPEIDDDKISKNLEQISEYFLDKRIVKFHHSTPISIIENFEGPTDYKIIGMARNPRDRAVSRAFHDKYHPKHAYQAKKYKTDFDAVRFIVMKSKPFMPDNRRQINRLMLDGYSTRCKLFDSLPYIWTTYEWMKDNPQKELEKIIAFLGLKLTNTYMLKKTILKHSFRKKAGRKTGVEERNNIWRRKGVMLDWINWFDEEMTLTTKDIQEQYWMKLIQNGGD